ncbi:MAG: tripartite tricarboxylate transporter TctB family protein [Pseudomonadota bacterium]
MLTQSLANIVFAVLIIGASIYFAVLAQDFEASGLLASSGLPSKFFPQLMLGFTAVCAVLVIYAYVVRGSAGGDDGEHVFETSGDARRGLLMLAVAVGCYFIWTNFGFIVMALLLGPTSLFAMGVRSPLIYGVVLLLTGCVYLVFTQLLNVQLV